MRQATKAGLCAVKRAGAYVGVRERPPGSNRGPLIDEWNKAAHVPLGSPWCMSFAHAMFAKCGLTLGGWASVGNFLAWAKAHGYEVSRPWRGCLVCYDWDGNAWYDHVELVERVLALRWFGGVRKPILIRTVGGNTGNMVRRQTRRPLGHWRFVRV